MRVRKAQAQSEGLGRVRRDKILNLDSLFAEALIAERFDIAVKEITDPISFLIERGENALTASGSQTYLHVLGCGVRLPGNNTEQIFLALRVAFAAANNDVEFIRRGFIGSSFEQYGRHL